MESELPIGIAKWAANGGRQGSAAESIVAGGLDLDQQDRLTVDWEKCTNAVWTGFGQCYSGFRQTEKAAGGFSLKLHAGGWSAKQPLPVGTPITLLENTPPSDRSVSEHPR